MLCVLSACTLIHSPESRRGTAEQIAAAAGFESRVIDTGEFAIQTWHHARLRGQRHLEIYIEGDGLAWRRKNRLSDNPTPVDPVALRLAGNSGSPAALYLARPCQYSDDINVKRCHAELWSSDRYSERVVAAMNSVVDHYVRSSGADSLSLIGYSGGGVIAALLAARRADVRELITVAANLDHRAWTAMHRVSPLDGSMNPPDHASELRTIPQRHFVGENDRIVTAAVLRSYLEQLGLEPDRHLHVIAGADHDCC
ncbi:MAG: alpha/beta hydrolase, partial [Gammaproteobacteria bacterium]|nr:alpha/beta hydrolase [Gammaproteobacteria bacterium]